MAVNVNNRNTNDKDEVFFEIKSYIGVLAEYQTGWKKEVNVVSWNGANPKFDIRDWSPDHDRMSRGITLHEEEARKLAAHLAQRFMKANNSNETGSMQTPATSTNRSMNNSESRESDVVGAGVNAESREGNVGGAEANAGSREDNFADGSDNSPSSEGCIGCNEESDVEDEKIPA